MWTTVSSWKRKCIIIPYEYARVPPAQSPERYSTSRTMILHNAHVHIYIYMYKRVLYARALHFHFQEIKSNHVHFQGPRPFTQHDFLQGFSFTFKSVKLSSVSNRRRRRIYIYIYIHFSLFYSGESILFAFAFTSTRFSTSPPALRDRLGTKPFTAVPFWSRGRRRPSRWMYGHLRFVFGVGNLAIGDRKACVADRFNGRHGQRQSKRALSASLSTAETDRPGSNSARYRWIMCRVVGAQLSDDRYKVNVTRRGRDGPPDNFDPDRRTRSCPGRDVVRRLQRTVKSSAAGRGFLVRIDWRVSRTGRTRAAVGDGLSRPVGCNQLRILMNTANAHG